LDASWNQHTPFTTPSFEIRKKMTSQQSKTVQKPGYRQPRTPAEKRYWELVKPDYREWFERDALTLDQAAALAMGLDPQCVDFVMADENSTMRARFLATKNWFSRNEKEFSGRPLHLETIWVKANDNGDDNLELPHFIEEALDLYQAKCLDVDRKIEALNDLITNVAVLKKLKKDLVDEKREAVLGAKTKSDQSAETRTSATDVKIIVALALSHVESRERPSQFIKLKNGERTNLAAKIVDCVREIFGEVIDEATALTRVKLAMENYTVDLKGTLTKISEESQN
jgi:hypothetical protein